MPQASDLDQHHARARLGLGHLVDDDLAVPENGSAHRRLLPVIFSLIAQRTATASAMAVAGGGNLRQAFGDGSPGTARSCDRRTRSRWAV